MKKLFKYSQINLYEIVFRFSLSGSNCFPPIVSTHLLQPLCKCWIVFYLHRRPHNQETQGKQRFWELNFVTRRAAANGKHITLNILLSN